MYLKFAASSARIWKGGTVRRSFREDGDCRISDLRRIETQTFTARADRRPAHREKIRNGSHNKKKKLGRKYESYWYSMTKGEWKNNSGWPTNEDWPKLQAWIVRKKNFHLPLQPEQFFRTMSRKSSATFFPCCVLSLCRLVPRHKFSSWPRGGERGCASVRGKW